MNSNPSSHDTAAAPSLAEIIARHPFLQGMDRRHIQVMAESAMQMQFKENELIFREGDPANRFYLIEEGKVVLESSNEHPLSIPVQVIGAGDVIGWSWLFPPYVWHFDARATEPTKAIFFYGTRLREQCESDHDLGYELMKRMTAVAISRLQAVRHELLAALTRSRTQS
jgi:CRP/FNR family transcriptional regulator, cyclic AMP receptor protein